MPSTARTRGSTSATPSQLYMIRMARRGMWCVASIRLWYRRNPFRGIDLEHGKEQLARRPGGGLCAARRAGGRWRIAFGRCAPRRIRVGHQRPENVSAGHLTWADYRPAGRPNAVRILHHKTGKKFGFALRTRAAHFPELTTFLSTLEQLGVPIVVMRPPKHKEGTSRPYLLRTARNRVRAAAQTPAYLMISTLAACRHGGLTELGDAELTEQSVMALSGHGRPEAARLYVKRTEMQRLAAARKHQAWVDAAKGKPEVAGATRPLPDELPETLAQSIGRGRGIRTPGPLLPKQVLYQAELCPDRAAL